MYTDSVSGKFFIILSGWRIPETDLSDQSKLRFVPPTGEFYAEIAGKGVSPGGDGPHDPAMDEERIGKLEQDVTKIAALMDGFRAVPQLTVTNLGVIMGMVGILATIAIFAFNNLSDRVDAIPKELSEEFRAMRAETAAQTSAIAASITAARQMQPQVVVVPAPSPNQQPPSPERQP